MEVEKSSAIEAPADRLLRPIREFMHQEVSGGIVLIGVTLIALVSGFAPWSEQYYGIWQHKITIGFGDAMLSKPLLLWINDGLMAIFFFLVGLEIKREILTGELSTLRKAALPIAAAIGGMVVPAGIYVIFNWGQPGMNGWGVPMATDIAFALGILALLGSRVPFSLKVFLTALAIIDDLGAVLIIALFYTSDISVTALIVAGVTLGLLVSLNRLQIRSFTPYLVLGIILWFAFLKSGVHATVAGVLLAMTIPARPKIDADTFVSRSRRIFQRIRGAADQSEKKRLHKLRDIREMSVDLESPLHRLEHELHPWTTYLVIPIFALANAGVTFSLERETMFHGVTLGVFLGLLVGKQVGVLFFSWIAVKAGFADRPEGISWGHIYGAGWLAGVGFTMSLFITGLAFPGGELVTMSKVGIILASFCSGVGGYLILRASSRKPAEEPQPEKSVTPAEVT